MQMIDVHLPTTDGRTIILSRYTQPEADLQLLLKQLKLELPEQPPPKITASHRQRPSHFDPHRGRIRFHCLLLGG
jgi:hypothetical protein